jgi:Tannase and feruloyl esterase
MPAALTYLLAIACFCTLTACQGLASGCESLANIKLTNTTITVAQAVPSGKFAPPYGDSLTDVPDFCRVAGVIKPSSDSYIRFEVWLPSSGWNEKYLGVGNGGFAGAIDYRALNANVKRGYATAATDTGHEGDGTDATWAYKRPEKIADFGYRAVHLTTENAKALIRAFYTRSQQHAYFDSCSNGGRQALMEAQRFPEDFDGILAGAPANNWTGLLSNGIVLAKEVYAKPEGYISSVKIPAIAAAVIEACDGQDGLQDGILNDPSKCRFDPSSLLCKGPESRECLTQPQIESLKMIYGGGRNTKGQQVFPGLVPGAEDGPGGWTSWITGRAPGQSAIGAFVDDYFRYMVLENPTWTSFSADVGTALPLATQKTARDLNATDPDLGRFASRGGKLILYHGWNDPAISALNTVHYYEAVQHAMGTEKAGSFVRLYMVPGMQHCTGGPGPNSFGQLGTTTARGDQRGIYSALEQWVEKGMTPGDIIATKYVDNNSSKGVQITRPICPYPQIARYNGSGDKNDASSFTCSASEK